MKSLLLTLVAAAAAFQIQEPEKINIGVLANHSGNQWPKDGDQECAGLKNGSLELIKCNMKVYNEAAIAANIDSVHLLVYPEGYALSGNFETDGYFDVFGDAELIDRNPCVTMQDKEDTMYQIYTLSCIARDNNVALVTNIAAQNVLDGARTITNVVFDNQGNVVSIYDKVHLFVTEALVFTSGLNEPAVF